jgi:putative heme-binding domain-containing protein
VLYDVATADGADAGLCTAALRALDKSIRQRNVAPAGADPVKLAKLVDASDEDVRIAAMRLAGAWRDADLSAPLKRAAEAEDAKRAVRQAAITSLADRGAEHADFLRSLDAGDRGFEVRAMAVGALSMLDLNDGAARAAALLATLPEKADPAPLLSGLLSRQGGGAALAKALATQKLTAQRAKLALRALEGTGRDEPALLESLRDAAGVKAVAAGKSLTPEQMTRRVADVQRYGDAARGEALFRSASLGCFKCHAIHGAGSTLGPDLGSIGASSPIDYLIDSMLDPGKQIKDGYQATIVETKGGDVHSAIKVSQDEREMVLRDAVQDRIVVPMNRVKSERPGGSLMPTGLTDTLQPGDLLHLVRFMSELGKPGPYQASPAQLIRRWRALPAREAGQLANEASPLRSAEASAKLPWAPQYSLVSGELPPDAMAEEGQPVAFVRGEIEVTTPGRSALHLGETRGLAMWVDAMPVDAKPLVEVDLPAGVHALTFRIDLGERGQGLRVEVRDVPGAGAHARPVGGR